MKSLSLFITGNELDMLTSEQRGKLDRAIRTALAEIDAEKARREAVKRATVVVVQFRAMPVPVPTRVCASKCKDCVRTTCDLNGARFEFFN